MPDDAAVATTPTPDATVAKCRACLKYPAIGGDFCKHCYSKLCNIDSRQAIYTSMSSQREIRRPGSAKRY